MDLRPSVEPGRRNFICGNSDDYVGWKSSWKFAMTEIHIELGARPHPTAIGYHKLCSNFIANCIKNFYKLCRNVIMEYGSTSTSYNRSRIDALSCMQEAAEMLMAQALWGCYINSSRINRCSFVYAGSSRDANGHRCLDEEERSDAINYGMLAAIVGGTFATTALLFIIILVATLIHWRRKHRYICYAACNSYTIAL